MQCLRLVAGLWGSARTYGGGALPGGVGARAGGGQLQHGQVLPLSARVGSVRWVARSRARGMVMGENGSGGERAIGNGADESLEEDKGAGRLDSWDQDTEDSDGTDSDGGSVSSGDDEGEDPEDEEEDHGPGSRVHGTVHGAVQALQDSHRALRPEGLAVGVSAGHNGPWPNREQRRVDAALQTLGWIL